MYDKMSNGIGDNFIVRICLRYFVFLSIGSWLFGFFYRFQEIFTKSEGFLGPLNWKITQYYVNYIQFGFVKRGVVGTLFYPLIQLCGENRRPIFVAILMLHLAVMMGIVLMLRRFLRERAAGGQAVAAGWLAGLLVLAPVGICAWAFDFARLDHLNFLLMLWVVLLLRHKQYWVSGLLLALGVLIHEALFLYGVVPCLLVAARTEPMGTQRLGRLVVLALPALGAAVAVALLGNASIDLQGILPAEVSGGASVWQRGLVDETAHPIAFYQSPLLMFYTVMPFVLLWWLRGGSIRAAAPALLALAPGLGLLLLGYDYARWTTVLFFSSLVILMLEAEKIVVTAPGRGVRLAFCGWLLPLGPIGITTALPYLSFVSYLTRRWL